MTKFPLDHRQIKNLVAFFTNLQSQRFFKNLGCCFVIYTWAGCCINQEWEWFREWRSRHQCVILAPSSLWEILLVHLLLLQSRQGVSLVLLIQVVIRLPRAISISRPRRILGLSCSWASGVLTERRQEAAS